MVRPRWIAAIFIANTLATLAGCRTTRPEVPPPPRFAADGRKISSNVVGFGSAPRAGYMTDAATQSGPAMAAPGGDRTSIASQSQPNDSVTSGFPGDAPPSTLGTPLPTANPAGSAPGSVAGSSKGLSVGGIFNGLGSSTKAKKDNAVVTAGSTDPSPPVMPLDPPVSLPPPPLVPPPAGIAPPVLPLGKDQTSQSPSALPPESAIPPVVPEQSP